MRKPAISNKEAIFILFKLHYNLKIRQVGRYINKTNYQYCNNYEKTYIFVNIVGIIF